ncbi:Flavonoid 3-O-glucosyltransferase [Hibiscus syriacus]|uniref:Glycosyltransferase n=1 Tax=Hibiscus syriacus TaxID=106335 RepID=A0A6A2XHN3_HIBSY|nr:flavonoid 3-O-glucosyltransferase-like [Hibiscus syriacus]KAE8657959.1 Flavonoid 3-O-glucosyltransferase [Hibiscus syriacus]
MEQAYKNASKHIAVMAFPFGTHAAPLLNLIRQLSEACPDAVFSFLSTQQSNSSTFPMKLDKVKPFNVRDGLPEGYMFKGNPHEPVEYFLKAVPANFTEVLDEVVAETGKPVDCLITDAFYAFGADIADELNIPWVAFWTAGPRALLVHAETNLIRQHVGNNGPQDKPLDFLPDFSGIRVADLPAGITSGDFNAAIPALLHKMELALPRAIAIAANSYEDLDNTVVNLLKLRFNMYLNVGPFNLVSSVSSATVDDSHGCLDWLNKHEPASVVYISFGSVITPPPHELQELCEALEESEFPFLWSYRGSPEKQLPQGFLERTSSKGKIVPWAPQQKILEHPSVGVFVSHGGWNSILESIVGGVPMIFRPFFGDQGLNTRTVEAVWGFGLGLEGGTLTKGGVMKALKMTLSGEQGKKMREKIGLEKELAYNAVKPNGSSVENFKTLVKIVCNKPALNYVKS